MSYTIKNNISFDEYYSIINRVVNDCFVDEVYSPAMYELSLRNALISVFCPDYDLSGCEDNNTLWERVTTPEANEIIKNIQLLDMGSIDYHWGITEAIDKAIKHRLAMIESSPMSLTDIALSKLVGVITDKVDSIDTDVMNKATIEALISASKESGKENFEINLVNAMVESGIISKPNRATRRSNAKKNKTDTKIVKVDTQRKKSRSKSY